MRTSRSTLSVVVVLLASLGSIARAADRPASEWVRRGADGKLAYKTTPTGDRIMDFSHAGYMGGGVALPDVAVKKHGQAERRRGRHEADPGGDRRGREAAAAMRAAFAARSCSTPGTFPCAETITITASGVVLRGSGSGGAERSTIKMTGKPHLAIAVRHRRATAAATAGVRAGRSATTRDDAEHAFRARSPTRTSRPARCRSPSRTRNGFAVGDTIVIRRPVTTSLGRVHADARHDAQRQAADLDPRRQHDDDRAQASPPSTATRSRSTFR